MKAKVCGGPRHEDFSMINRSFILRLKPGWHHLNVGRVTVLRGCQLHSFDLFYITVNVLQEALDGDPLSNSTMITLNPTQDVPGGHRSYLHGAHTHANHEYVLSPHSRWLNAVSIRMHLSRTRAVITYPYTTTGRSTTAASPVVNSQLTI